MGDYRAHDPTRQARRRKRTIDVREILNGIFYVLSTGCQWQALPKDLPPKSTVWAYFDLWTWDGTLERIHHALYVAVREQAGPEASPTTAIIDSQSAKGAQKGGSRSTRRASMRARPCLPCLFTFTSAFRRLRAGGRESLPRDRRYARPLAERGANIQDRDGMMLVLDRLTRRLFPFIERIYGDGGYQGPKAARAAAKTGCWTIEIVGRRPTAVGFEVLPERWIVERTFAWLSRFRRLARDFERYARTVAAFICLAMIRIMLKRLVANPSS